MYFYFICSLFLSQVLEVSRSFGKVKIEFNRINDQDHSMCVYFGNFVY